MSIAVLSVPYFSNPNEYTPAVNFMFCDRTQFNLAMNISEYLVDLLFNSEEDELFVDAATISTCDFYKISAEQYAHKADAINSYYEQNVISDDIEDFFNAMSESIFSDSTYYDDNNEEKRRESFISWLADIFPPNIPDYLCVYNVKSENINVWISSFYQGTYRKV